jgi:hypothetical protein
MASVIRDAASADDDDGIAVLRRQISEEE